MPTSGKASRTRQTEPASAPSRRSSSRSAWEGRIKPIGDDLGGSTISVSTGGQYIHGLRDAMGSKK